MHLKREYFEKDVVSISKSLLGDFVVHQTEKGKIVGKIVETEAYGDAGDLASHARFGNRGRSQIMFGPAGILYVYSIYGLFYLTNIICGKEGNPSAVLIRAAEIVEGSETALANLQQHRYMKKYYQNKSSISSNLASGPGKFSAAFGIDKTMNGIDLEASNTIYIESANTKPIFDIIETTRIGIDYAGDCRELPWRFYIKNNPYISKR